MILVQSCSTSSLGALQNAFGIAIEKVMFLVQLFDEAGGRKGWYFVLVRGAGGREQKDRSRTRPVVMKPFERFPLSFSFGAANNVGLSLIFC